MQTKLARLLPTSGRLFSQFKHEIALCRKAHTKVIEKYEALPDWMTYKPRDPFDYPLRSKESVRQYQAENPPDFNINVEWGFTSSEHHEYKIRDRLVWVTVKIDEMRLTPKMQDRLIFLLGDRWHPVKREVRIKVGYYTEMIDNYKKAMEILKELYFEALRAP